MEERGAEGGASTSADESWGKVDSLGKSVMDFPSLIRGMTPSHSHWGKSGAKSGWVSAQPTPDSWLNHHIFSLSPPSASILSVSVLPLLRMHHSPTPAQMSGCLSLQNSPLFQYLHDLGHTDFEACPTASQEDEYGGQEGDLNSPDEDQQKTSVSSSHAQHKSHTCLPFFSFQSCPLVKLYWLSSNQLIELIETLLQFSWPPRENGSCSKMKRRTHTNKMEYSKHLQNKLT